MGSRIVKINPHTALGGLCYKPPKENPGDRLAIQGVLLHGNRLIAANGFALASVAVEVEYIGEEPPGKDIIIPVKAFKAARKAREMTINDDGTIVVDDVIYKPIDATYPNYKQVIQMAKEKEVVFSIAIDVNRLYRLAQGLCEYNISRALVLHFRGPNDEIVVNPLYGESEGVLMSVGANLD